MALHQGIAVRQYLDRSDISVTDFSLKIGISRANAYSLFGRERIDKNLRERIINAFPEINLNIDHVEPDANLEILQRLDEIDKWRKQINTDLALIKRLLTEK